MKVIKLIATTESYYGTDSEITQKLSFVSMRTCQRLALEVPTLKRGGYVDVGVKKNETLVLEFARYLNIVCRNE